MSEVQPAVPGSLKRTLTLWDLVFYGIVLVQPVAPMGIFGVVSKEARGPRRHHDPDRHVRHAAHGDQLRAHGARLPERGLGLHLRGPGAAPGLGYVTGWSMVMDYVLNPIICTIWCSKAAMNFLPEVPYAVWAVIFAALFTALNLRGVKASARTNESARGGDVRRRRAVPAAPRSATCWTPPLDGRRPHAPVLRSGDVLLAGRAHRRLDRGADLHRLRRHLDAVRGGREPAPQHPARDGAHLPRAASWRPSRSTPRSSCGAPGTASPTWTRPSSTWRARPAAPCCS